MIVTIALNPSVNKLAVVDGLEVNGINTVQDYRMCLGESTIYTAYIIKLLQGEPHVIGFLGGIGGRYIKHFMDKNRIKSDLVFNLAESKSIYRIVDSIHGTETTLLDNGMIVNELNIKNLKHKLQNHIHDAKVMVIGGDLPAGAEFSLIEESVAMANKKGVKIICSLKGDQLRKALALNPYGVKVNKDTVIDLVQLDPINEGSKDILKALYEVLTRNKVHYMVYDAADEGIYVLSKNKICHVDIRGFMEILDGIGSSDALVGAFAVAVERNYEQEKMAKLILATSLAVKNSKYPVICHRKDIDCYHNKVKVTEIMNKKQGFIG